MDSSCGTKYPPPCHLQHLFFDAGKNFLAAWRIRTASRNRHRSLRSARHNRTQTPSIIISLLNNKPSGLLILRFANLMKDLVTLIRGRLQPTAGSDVTFDMTPPPPLQKRTFEPLGVRIT